MLLNKYLHIKIDKYKKKVKNLIEKEIPILNKYT